HTALRHVSSLPTRLSSDLSLTEARWKSRTRWARFFRHWMEDLPPTSFRPFFEVVKASVLRRSFTSPKGRKEVGGKSSIQWRKNLDRKSTRLNSSHLGISYA